MTKKSAARLERDAQAKEQEAKLIQFEKIKKTNKCWDELKQIANSCANMMLSTNAQLAAIYKTEGISNFLPNPVEVKTTLRGLSQDLLTFNEDLSRIFNSHKDRSGGFTNEDDFAASISVFEAYHAFQTRYDAIISPSVTYLLEQAAAAEQSILAAIQANKTNLDEQAKIDLVNPDVVSDAVIK